MGGSLASVPACERATASVGSSWGRGRHACRSPHRGEGLREERLGVGTALPACRPPTWCSAHERRARGESMILARVVGSKTMKEENARTATEHKADSTIESEKRDRNIVVPNPATCTSVLAHTPDCGLTHSQLPSPTGDSGHGTLLSRVVPPIPSTRGS
eukprot:7387402-Prymnesium_polylepis.3